MDDQTEKAVDRIAELIKSSRRLVVFTGAGASTNRGFQISPPRRDVDKI